ncbi:MAG: hypothetical protein P4L99_28060 [Chthoniobacter sp.]|nr:hypothetical protein [Chthoniobacter sp.]
MKHLRFVPVFLFLALAALLAFASPLAQANPALAVVAGAGLVWGGALLISPVNLGVFAAISTPSALKLDEILNGAAITALKRKLLPLLALSTVFRDVVLKGTDIVQVPFVPLQQTASLDFDQDVGYEDGDGTILTRPITVNKRKYQPIAVTSRQLAREPILMLEELIVKKVEQLAEDIITDIFSLVTLANYGAAAVTLTPASWDSDTINELLRKAANDAMWPESGRALVVNTAVDAALLSDTSVKAAYAYGDNTVVRDGKLPRIFGFDYAAAPVFPGNGENLIGFAALRYAILTAFAPIQPSKAVRSVMIDYRTGTDTDTGLTLEYRNFGTAYGDKELHIVECNYGYGLGDPAQLLRAVSA